MSIRIDIGDIVEQSADVLVCPANPWLNLSGGIGGEILERHGEVIQAELHNSLASAKKRALPAGSVVVIRAGELLFNYIVHAIAIDPFYDSSVKLVEQTLTAALDACVTLDANTVCVPALATGYGRLSIEEFAAAATSVLLKNRDWRERMEIRFVFLDRHHVDVLRAALIEKQLL